MSDHGLSGLLGAGTTWSGELCFDGRVRIDGLFDGRISTPDFLEIGLTGEVRGFIEAAQVLVAGLVDGTVKSRERITVLETARVRGRLEAPWIDVRPGAQVDAWIAAGSSVRPSPGTARLSTTLRARRKVPARRRCGVGSPLVWASSPTSSWSLSNLWRRRLVACIIDTVAR